MYFKLLILPYYITWIFYFLRSIYLLWINISYVYTFINSTIFHSVRNESKSNFSECRNFVIIIEDVAIQFGISTSAQQLERLVPLGIMHRGLINSLPETTRTSEQYFSTKGGEGKPFNRAPLCREVWASQTSMNKVPSLGCN